MKKRVKVYVISDSPFYDATAVENILEYQLALSGVKSLVFSSNYLHRIRDDKSRKGIDWAMKNSLTEALIAPCDAVAVVGTSVTEKMREEISLAIKMNKKICLSPDIKKVYTLPVPDSQLVTVCKEALAAG